MLSQLLALVLLSQLLLLPVTRRPFRSPLVALSLATSCLLGLSLLVAKDLVEVPQLALAAGLPAGALSVCTVAVALASGPPQRPGRDRHSGLEDATDG